MKNINPSVAKELNQIISFLPKEQVEKIPQDIRDIIQKEQDESFASKINSVEDINDSNIQEETKIFLAYLYMNYIGDEEEKKELEAILDVNELRYQKQQKIKYDVYNVFEQRKEKSLNNDSLPVIIENKSFWKKFFEKLKKLFKRY